MKNIYYTLFIVTNILLLKSITCYSQEIEKKLVFRVDQCIEAESGEINGPIRVYALQEASGGKFIRNHYSTSKRLNDPDQQESSDVSYTVDIPKDGNYHIWFYSKAPVIHNVVFGKYLTLYIGSDCSNYNLCTVNLSKKWGWQRITNLRLKKGLRTIDFKHNDWNIGIDQIYITSTGSDLSALGPNPSKEEILKANFNASTPITYPEWTEKDGANLNFPVPPSEHPRLFLREHDIADLKAKVNNPLMGRVWEKILAGSKEPVSGMLDAPVDGAGNYSRETINAIEAKALMYVLYKDKAVGRNSIDAMINFFRTVKFNPSTGDISRIYGRIILTASVVYDWCYDLLTKEEKTMMIGWIETMASRMEIGWPVIKQRGVVTGHQSELQMMRDLMAGGIATYDEKKEMYMLAAGRFFKDYISVRKFFYPGGFHHQGSSYGGFRFLSEIYATALFDRMGYPNIFGKEQQNVPYYAFYTRRPDGQLMRDGDNYVTKRKEHYWSEYGEADLISASLFKDPVIMGEAMRELDGFDGSHDYLFDFILCDPLIIPKPADTQPLSRYFPSPLGAMVVRTGWDSGKNSSAVVATMKIGEYYFGNHQHLDAGSFQLYYKGALASEAGCYDSYGSLHDVNYHKRTVAHNSILVFDPEERFPGNRANDGGQRFPNDGKVPDNLQTIINKGYKTGKTVAHQFGPDPVNPEYTYIKGDLTMAYTDKIKQFQRSFVFLNLNDNNHPAALIVFDKVVSSDKNFKKSWLLHCIEEPDIDGINTTITRTQKGYNGKLVNTTLYPTDDNLQVTKVGEPGHEFKVQGINYAPAKLSDPNTTSDESGSWRIEVSPIKPEEQNLFLNAMQIMDNIDGPTPLKTERIFSDQLTGAKIADRVVLFNRDGNNLNSKVMVNLIGDQIYKVLVTDLEKGTWRVEKIGEKKIAEYEVSDEGGALYFKGSKGKYVLSPVKIRETKLR